MLLETARSFYGPSVGVHCPVLIVHVLNARVGPDLLLARGAEGHMSVVRRRRDRVGDSPGLALVALTRPVLRTDVVPRPDAAGRSSPLRPPSISKDHNEKKKH